MSNKRGKQKNSTDTDGFEAFVRESLVKLSEGQDRILHDVAILKGKVQLNEWSLNDISARLTKSTRTTKKSRANSMMPTAKSKKLKVPCKIKPNKLEQCTSNSCPSSAIRVKTTKVPQHPGVSWGGLPSENRRYFN